MPCFVSVGLLLASVEGSIDIGITKEYLVFLYSYIIILVTCG
jgi:hypothetical protein